MVINILTDLLERFFKVVLVVGTAMGISAAFYFLAKLFLLLPLAIQISTIIITATLYSCIIVGSRSDGR